MSTLPGRTGAIALSLSFAATFGLVLAVAGTAADLAAVPERPAASAPRPHAPSVTPRHPGLYVDAAGVHLDGRFLVDTDAAIAGHHEISRGLLEQARSAKLDLLAGSYGARLHVAEDGSPAAALSAAAAALEMGYAIVLLHEETPAGARLACELTAPPTEAAIAAAKMSGSVDAACAAANAT